VRHFGIVFVVGLLGLGACGGGGKSSTQTTTSAASAERTRLESQLRSSLEAPTSELASARDLDSCVLDEAREMPLPTLRRLAASDQVAVADPLLARCVAQGKGLSWIRGAVATTVTGQLPASTPPAFIHCALAGVDRLTSAQLATALQRGASGNQAYSVRLGQRIALLCIQKPGIFEQYRRQLVIGIRESLAGRHLPAPFVQCVLNRANHISPVQLATLVQGGPGVENAFGQKLGRECRGVPSA
jgi:hypothetical protein